MKIDKEKFDKLKQLDRIEYRQKLNEIKEKYSFSFSYILFWGMFICGLLLILVGLNIYEVSLFNIDGGVNEGVEWGYETFESLFNTGIIVFKLALLFLLIEIFMFMIYAVLEHKKIAELNEEYFLVEVKK